MTKDNITLFVQAYIEAMKWLTTENELDLDLSDANDYELSQGCSEKIQKDCAEFIADNLAVLQSVISTAYTWGSAGHDFYLTRNGHGAGFWDRGLGSAGDVLSDAARACGETHEFIAEDGLIYSN